MCVHLGQRTLSNMPPNVFFSRFFASSMPFFTSSSSVRTARFFGCSCIHAHSNSVVSGGLSPCTRAHRTLAACTSVCRASVSLPKWRWAWPSRYSAFTFVLSFACAFSAALTAAP